MRKDSFILLVSSFIFLVLSLYDKYTFVYHPWQRNVIIDFDDKNDEVKNVLFNLEAMRISNLDLMETSE
jgi:hypothetical protein